MTLTLNKSVMKNLNKELNFFPHFSFPQDILTTERNKNKKQFIEESEIHI